MNTIKIDWNTPERLTFLNRLNYILKEKEQQIAEGAVFYLEILEQRLKAKDVFTHDYEVQVEVEYFSEETDEPIHTFLTDFHYQQTIIEKDYMMLLDKRDHRETYMPILEEPYCYLLHDLIDHSHIGDELFKIRNLWININIMDQHTIEVNGS